MSSGDVSHPIPSSPTRPCGLAGRVHSRTPHTAHPGAHAWDRHVHPAHVVPHSPAHAADTHTARPGRISCGHPGSAHARRHARRQMAPQSRGGRAALPGGPQTPLWQSSCRAAPSSGRGRSLPWDWAGGPDATAPGVCAHTCARAHIRRSWGSTYPHPPFRVTQKRPDPWPCRVSWVLSGGCGKGAVLSAIPRAGLAFFGAEAQVSGLEVINPPCPPGWGTLTWAERVGVGGGEVQRSQGKERPGKEKPWRINFLGSAKWPAAAPSKGAGSWGDWGLLEIGEGPPLTYWAVPQKPACSPWHLLSSVPLAPPSLIISPTLQPVP